MVHDQAQRQSYGWNAQLQDHGKSLLALTVSANGMIVVLVEGVYRLSQQEYDESMSDVVISGSGLGLINAFRAIADSLSITDEPPPFAPIAIRSFKHISTWYAVPFGSG